MATNLGIAMTVFGFVLWFLAAALAYIGYWGRITIEHQGSKIAGAAPVVFAFLGAVFVFVPFFFFKQPIFI